MFNKKQELLDARQKVAQLLEIVGLDMSRDNQEQLAFLARRSAWVQKRIQSMATQRKIHLYDEEEEVKALNWAIRQIIVQEAELNRFVSVLSGFASHFKIEREKKDHMDDILS